MKNRQNHKLGFKKYDMREYWNKRAEIGKDIYDKVCAYCAPNHFNEIMEKIQRDILIKAFKTLSNPIAGRVHISIEL